MNKTQKRRTFFRILRYGGLLVTALGIALVLVPGAWPEMPEGIEGYMIFGGSIMNAVGRLSRKTADPGSPDPTHRSPALAIAEGLQDAALIL